ncbi:MAG: sensor histidine kinase [Gemmatimonadaceae bacterium]
MSSIRARLTRAYTGALIATLVAFAAALWITRRAGSYSELQRYVLAEANLALNIVRQAEEAGQPITIIRDSIVGPSVTPALVTLLEGVPDYLLVLDRDGRSLYISRAALRLRPDDLADLQAIAIAAPTNGSGELVTVGDEKLLLSAAAPRETESGISRVVAAASTKSADVALRDLMGTMSVIAPLLIIISWAIAYNIAGRALRPVELIIDEVRAISDGRSLHRRLPIEDDGDEIGRLTVTLNEMLERLEKSFSGLRRFTADASHELKTPLAVLRADVERAMSSTAGRSEKMVALEEALQETRRMADLVDSLLTLARADEGRLDIHREPVNLEPLAREVFETASILGEAAGIHVTMPALAPATVMGDYTRLRQLFLNLVSNALKYTRRDGSVEIALTTTDTSATFSVRDTGIGISATDLPHIFERFYRADRARSRSSDGAGVGLGLAISQWVAEAHGGSIAVRSRLGRGSTFAVTLPSVPATVQSEGAATEPSDEPARQS